MPRLIALPPKPILWVTLGLLALGGLGGALVSLTPAPMPWMMGSLAVTALVVVLRGADLPQGYRFPLKLRQGFVAIIGALIGAQVDPDMVARAGELWVSLAAVTVFVALGHLYNYHLFRRLAGYDRPTAFFAGTPGGLIESIEMGDAAGADVRMLTLQHYWRVILVIVLLPTALSLFHGEALGSAAGERLSADAQSDLSGLPALAVVAGLGAALAWLARLPAYAMLGPLVLAAVLSATGLLHLHSPPWVVALAQAVMGVSIGARFVGVTLRMIRLSIGYAMVSVLGMLVLGAGLAVLVAPWATEGVEVLLIALAPGGAIEMGLVALSLSVNPAFVTFHHLYRIGIAVIDISVVARWMGFDRKTG